MKSLLTFSLVLAAHVLAEPILPQRTEAHAGIVYNGKGWSARPTQAPQLELLKRRLGENVVLPKRAAVSFTSGEFLGFIAPDNTCGYIDGEFGMWLSSL
jgi:hypothetical protein